MNPGSYSPKNLAFNEDARHKLISGITKLADAVKSTLGPMGQTVLIESQNHVGGLTVTKDGVTVAKAIDLIDPIENLAVKIMKQAADKTALDAGDGTTTSIVLAEALIKEIDKTLSAPNPYSKLSINKSEYFKAIVRECEEYVNYLSKSSIRLTKKNLLDVATISANNDKEIGKIIAEAYRKVGKDGVVTVEKSSTEKTYSFVTDGFKLDRGYSSALFINNQERDECIFDDCYVLVCDAEIDNIFQIENVLKGIVKSQKKLLIIAPASANMLNTLAANVVKNKVRVCVVQPPNFGWKSHEQMQDIAVSLGATYFSEKTGDDLSLATMDDLGFAEKVTVGRHTTLIMRDESIDNTEIDERVEQLHVQLKENKKKSERDFIRQRIASLKGGVGVIYVGGMTDIEQKEKFDRIEDAVCAVRAALEEGILPGGGIALYNYYLDYLINWKDYKTPGNKTVHTKLAKDTLAKVCAAPIKQIHKNAGIDLDDLEKNEITALGFTPEVFNKWGYDVKSGMMGDMMKMGIIDPTKVTKSALLNAVSVATTIMSTNAIVTLARAYETQE